MTIVSDNELLFSNSQSHAAESVPGTPSRSFLSLSFPQMLMLDHKGTLKAMGLSESPFPFHSHYSENVKSSAITVNFPIIHVPNSRVAWQSGANIAIAIGVYNADDSRSFHNGRIIGSSHGVHRVHPAQKVKKRSPPIRTVTFMSHFSSKITSYSDLSGLVTTCYDHSRIEGPDGSRTKVDLVQGEKEKEKTLKSVVHQLTDSPHLILSSRHDNPFRNPPPAPASKERNEISPSGFFFNLGGVEKSLARSISSRL
ncbi:hypothetical protein EV360DRAFT_74176 [Lentinula raphanica]|nr:hypothetical protein EV360DRAFT_74176 [Lentinula raphanica]